MAAAEIAQPLEHAEYGQRVRAAIVDSLLITFAVVALVVGLSVFAARGGPFANLLNTLAYLIYWPARRSTDRAASRSRKPEPQAEVTTRSATPRAVRRSAR